jgi:hypothetical protein
MKRTVLLGVSEQSVRADGFSHAGDKPLTVFGWRLSDALHERMVAVS